MKLIFRAVFCFLASIFSSEAVIRFQAPANEAFATVINPITFGFTSPDDTEVSYVVEMSPENTEWVQFLQKRLILVDGSLSPGVVYGTPRQSAVGTTARLQITAYSATKFQSASEEMEIEVGSGEVPAEVYLFQLSSMNIFEFLGDSRTKEEFVSNVSKIWTTGSESGVKIFQYFTYEERGTRISIPAPGQRPKEGLYIVAGPTSNEATAEVNRVDVTCSGISQQRLLPTNYETIAIPFNIEWCSFEEFTIEGDTEKIVDPPRESGYEPVARPTEDDLDQLDIFLKTVIALLAVAIVLFLLLAYVMCCRRKTTRDYERQPAGDEYDGGSEVVVNKKAIQGASTKLRRIPIQPNWDAFILSKGLASPVRDQPDRKVLLHSDDDEMDKPDSYRKSGLLSSDDDELNPKKSLPSYRNTPRYSSAESSLEKKPSLERGRPPPAYVKPPEFGGTVSPSMVDARLSSPEEPQARHRPTTSHSPSATESDLGSAAYKKPHAFGETIIESEPQDV